ncbi:hypothetical protein F5880DRAFT_1096778 [Lentinula raphanica]|nr:hypothetical protein F5880DRAFT_1096778 [Lentinula raphanica]
MISWTPSPYISLTLLRLMAFQLQAELPHAQSVLKSLNAPACSCYHSDHDEYLQPPCEPLYCVHCELMCPGDSQPVTISESRLLSVPT